MVLIFFKNSVRNIFKVVFGQNYDQRFQLCVERVKHVLNYDRLINIYFICRYICAALNQRRIDLFKERPKYTVNPEHIKNKCVVISDCYTEYGKAITKVMLSNGAKVIAGCRAKQFRNDRSMDALLEEFRAECVGCSIRMVALDLMLQQSIEMFASEVSQHSQQIDILICNACYVSETNVRETTMAFGEYRQSLVNTPFESPETVAFHHGFERHFAANHLGHFVLTHLLLDRLKASANARIVVESSASYIFGPNSLKDISACLDYTTPLAYFQSKFANILFARGFARRAVNNESLSNIKIYSVDSENISTQLRFFTDLGIPLIERLLYVFYYPVYYRPELAPNTTLFCALDPSVSQQSGDFYSNCRRVDTNISDSMAEELWKLSCDLAQIDFNP